jgi:hypothetical protein
MDGFPSFLSNMLLGISERRRITVSLARTERNGNSALTKQDVWHEEQGQDNVPLNIVH